MPKTGNRQGKHEYWNGFQWNKNKKYTAIHPDRRTTNNPKNEFNESMIQK